MFKNIAAKILQKPINALFRCLVWLVVEINEELTDTKSFKERAQHLKDTTFLFFEEIKYGK